VRRIVYHTVVPRILGLHAEPDEPVDEILTTEPGGVASRGADGTQRQQRSDAVQAEESHDTSQLRSDTPVVSIAAKVEAEILGFNKMVQLWDEDPVTRENVDQKTLTDWKEIPVACGFRVLQPAEDGVQRWATAADKVAQQQKYAKCLAWALECRLTEPVFQKYLDAVPTNYHQRGVVDLPATLKSKQCSSWEHARRLCASMSIRTVAADAGRRLGGEVLAALAAEEMVELMSSASCRLNRWLMIPERWRGDTDLRLPADSVSPTSGIKSLPGFFEMWLRRQAAALMGRHADENWRTVVSHGSQSSDSKAEGFSQRHSANQQQSQTGEVVPSHFVLDGEACQLRAGQRSVTTAWHGFLWRTACVEVRRVTNHGCVWYLQVQGQNIHIDLLLSTQLFFRKLFKRIMLNVYSVLYIPRYDQFCILHPQKRRKRKI
jgi:hypothetical protein